MASATLPDAPPASNDYQPAPGPSALAGHIAWPAHGDATFASWTHGPATDAHAQWHHAGDLSIGLHGEILNLGALGQELGVPDGAGGAAVLASGWRRWGIDCLAHLRGVFALIIRSSDDLVLYRDFSGLRALYLDASTNPGTLAFATHLAALPGNRDQPRRVSRPSLQEYLRYLEIASPHTLLSGVVSVEPGRPVHWRRGGPVQTGPWPTVPPPTRTPNFQSAVDELGRLLHDSVEQALVDVERPGAFLSGGVDSALLCALAAKAQRGVTAITVGFDDATFDESPVAKRVAAHLGIAHEVWRFSAAQYRQAFERLCQQAEQPITDPAAMATLLSFERVGERFDAMLDGTGADEAVGLMPPRHLRTAVAYASLLPTRLRRASAGLLVRLPVLSAYASILDFEHPADTLSRWHGFRPSEIASLTGTPASLGHTQFMQTYARFPRTAHFERYSALLNVMGCDRLNQAVAISGATIRYPFWDAETTAFIRQLPGDFRYLPGHPKRILRALLARFVPADIWNLPKHGFDFPLHAFLAQDRFSLVRQYLHARRWQTTDLLQAHVVQDLGERFMAGDKRLTFRVWALVVLAAWLEHHPELRQTTA